MRIPFNIKFQIHFRKKEYSIANTLFFLSQKKKKNTIFFLITMSSSSGGPFSTLNEVCCRIRTLYISTKNTKRYEAFDMALEILIVFI